MPELINRFAYGMVELYRDALARTDHVAVPGCYPTAVGLALAPLVASRLVDPKGIIAERGLGSVGRGPRAEDDEPVLGGERERDRIRLAHAPPHRGDGAGALARRPSSRRGAVHTASRTDDARHPRDVLRATRGLGPVDGATPRAVPEFYADDPCVVVVDDPSGTKATYGANVVHMTVRFDMRTETVLAIATMTTSPRALRAR